MSSKSLSSAEKYTWDIIQQHYDEIPEISISKLADMAHVSMSTINRTVQKKGFRGYAAFRFSVKEKQIPQIDGFSKEILTAIAKNEEELVKTINGISAASIEKIVKMIDEAQEIMIFSRGLSTNVANEMLKKLQLFHEIIRAEDDPKYMVYYAQFVKAGTLVIAISLSGETEEILQSTQIAKAKGAKTFAITASDNSSLTKLCDISLVGYKSLLEVNYFDLDVHSRLPLYILMRILFDAYSIYKKRNDFCQ